MSEQPRSLFVPIHRDIDRVCIAGQLLVCGSSAAKQWKEALIDNMTARFLAPPVALPSPDEMAVDVAGAIPSSCA